MKTIYNNLDQTLRAAGLSASERTLYLAGLYKGTLGSAELIKLTGMKRPTVMAALSSLHAKTLCSKRPDDKRSLRYEMLPPSNLKAYLGTQSKELDALMSSLDSLALPATDTFQVMQSNGEKAVQSLLELALRCKSRQWQIIAPRDNALRFMSKSYQDYFKRVRAERQIVSQTLWEPVHADKSVPLGDILRRKPRYVPESIAMVIPSMMIAFDDCLLIVSGVRNQKGEIVEPSAILLQGGQAVTTFQIIFEMAWRSVR